MAVGAIESRPRNADLGVAEPSLPFFFRWVLEAPVSVWWLAVGLAAVLSVIQVVVINLSGLGDGLHFQGVPIWRSWVGLMMLVYAVWWAWIPVAIFYLVRGAERDFAALTPLFADADSHDRLRADAFSFSSKAFKICVVVGCLVTGSSLSLLILADDAISVTWPWAGSWVMLREFLGNLLTVITLGWGLVVGARLSALVRSRARISLLDTTKLAPLAQNGTRLALVWLVTFSIGIPTLAMPGGSSFLAGALLVTFIGMASAAVAVAVPLLGARRLLGELKTAELGRVHEAIDSARRAALDVPESEAGARAADRLPGLLAWEARVAEVPVWLLDLGAWRKLALYLLIPLASWVCAALVERLIDSTLS